MMQSRAGERGAVSLMFLIFTIVVGLIGWGLWYLEFTKNEQVVADAAAATTAKGDALDGQFKYRRAYEAIANAVGNVGTLPEPSPDESIEDYMTKIQPAVRRLEETVREAKNLFEGDETVDTLVEVVQPAAAKIDAHLLEITRLQRDLETARQDRTAAEAANDEMISAHAGELARRNEEVDQLRQRSASQLQASEEKNEQTQTELAKLTDTYETSVVEHRKSVDQLRFQKEQIDREVRDWKRELKHERVWNVPDGKVIDVDDRAGLCWIDVGSRHQLRRGTRFRTYGIAKGGVREYHGYIVVRDIERDRALCAVENGSPVERGDFVTNPYFDREGKKVFYFLGRLPGRFDNQRARAILEDFGAEVADGFSIEVDFLVLGANPDPEAVGEDADLDWFKQTEEYNDALRWGVEMLRARDLEGFLQY